MNVLVLGGTGYIGSHMVKPLGGGKSINIGLFGGESNHILRWIKFIPTKSN